MTKVSLRHIYASVHNLDVEIFIIDNGSKDHSAEIIRSEFPNAVLIENGKNVGFGRANNQALPYTNSRYVLLINTDAFVEKDTILKTVQYMDANPKCGILGVKLLGQEGELQPSCRYFPTPWNIFLRETGLNRIFKWAKMVDDMSWDHASVRECDWVTGCFYLVRKVVIDQVGLFDPRYFLYYEEVDHCLAVKNAGWQVIYYPYTSVVHLCGESAKLEGEITSNGRQLEPIQIESELLYFRKNHGVISVIVDVFLVTLADGIQLFKDIVKLRWRTKRLLQFKHTFMVWRLFFQTRMGKQPTR
jgi:N-acetylglucosaminyl-diphospho-decaprenol L-rhamnosyltransferase